MLKIITHELRHHVPFTLFGTVTGIAIVLLSHNLPQDFFLTTFYVLHPAHVLLSAIATTSMYQMHTCTRSNHKCNIWTLLAIGYFGSVGIATLSDSVIPYFGEKLLQMPHSYAHIGFIEKWWLVNPLAVVGVGIAYFWPQTKLPHTGHVLLSTWASLFHMLLALGPQISFSIVSGIFIFLFISVWLPCCLSDIIFPLLFVKKTKLGDHHGYGH
jgi:hypothetical protein